MRPASFPLLQSLPPNIFPSSNHKVYGRPKAPPAAPLASLVRAPSGPRSLGARCASSSEDGRGPALPDGDVVSGMVEGLLKREENRALLVGLENASQRVDRARAALADIERQEANARHAKEYVRQLENRESEIAESQRELVEARAMVEEAQRSLSLNMDTTTSGDTLNEAVNKDVERGESVKAAVVSSIIGTLASLPISLYQCTSSGQLVLQLITISISCALFGVTHRYTIRRDLDNIQLKTGTSAAFGFVKGLSLLAAGEPLEPNVGSLISHSISGAVYVAEDILIFLSAAIALDFCFKMRFLSPFPIRKWS